MGHSAMFLTDPCFRAKAYMAGNSPWTLLSHYGCVHHIFFQHLVFASLHGSTNWKTRLDVAIFQSVNGSVCHPLMQAELGVSNA